jgi:hypothetical protein
MGTWNSLDVFFQILNYHVILENEFARTLKEKEEEFSSTVDELKGKLYETESRNKGTACAQLFNCQRKAL